MSPPAPSPAQAGEAARGSRRRRLWELPPAAHELLLGLALPAELLRATVARAVGHQQRARCKLGGTDADVLFSTVHDLAQRNVVSEALHKLLDARHATAVRQLARVRDAAGLLQAWSQALAEPAPGPALPALLWAALTHALGPAVQDELLYAVRHWIYARTRAALVQAAQASALRQDCAQLRGELTQARAAAERAHAQADARATADAQAIAALRGELARVTQATAAGPTPALVTPSPAQRQPVAPRVRDAQPEPTEPTRPVARRAPPPAAPAQAEQVRVQGRKVLCVGGIHSAVHRYRALVEARGGHFLHHDGGIEHSLQRLQSQLDTADLVLCQAACVNHEAYRCVKLHCKRAGTACIYLDRPSLSRFARELGVAA